MSKHVLLEAPTFEHHPSGLGVGCDKPRISWRFRSSEDDSLRGQGWQQESYEVELARNAATQSFHIEGASSVLVPWPSSPLSSRERASVRVRSLGSAISPDGGGRFPDATQWSPWATVEAALLHRSDWQPAQMITSSVAPPPDGPLRPLRFRKAFDVSSGGGKISQARLYVTSHGVYETFINGVRVGDHAMAPGWTSYNHRLNYQIFDVTSLLVGGQTNIIAAEVAEGWFATRLIWGEGQRRVYGDKLALLAKLHVQFENDDTQVLVSDSTWGCKPSAIVSSEIYDGEIFDTLQEEEAWTSSASSDGWAAVKALPLPRTRLTAPDSPPVRVIESLLPTSIVKSRQGKVLIDFGQILTGKLCIRSLTKAAGHRVSFRHAEVLEDGELCVRPLRNAKSTDTIICSGEELRNWSPKYTFHGFRFVQVDGWSPEDDSGPLTADSITALVLHTDIRRTGTFRCSHQLVNQLHENAVWSMRGNFLSVPTDCPQRDERLGWTGDIQVFSPSASFLYDTAGMLGGWLEDVAAEQESDDAIVPQVVPVVLPTALKHVPQAVWGDAAVIVPWVLFRSSGDLEILRRQYHSMRSWLDQGIRRGTNGLWDPDLWQLGDWLDPTAPPEDPGNGRTDGGLVADAYLVHVTSLMSKIASLVDRSDDASRYAGDHARLKAEFQKQYISPAGLVVCDTQTALALVIVFDLYQGENQKAAIAQRLSRQVRYAQFRIATGFAGTPIITHALAETGQVQLAYRMLLGRRCPSWLYAVTMGATTIWERWDSMLPDGSINPGEMTSFNHYALGSVVNWLHDSVGGIRPLEAGWKKFVVKPVPGGTIDEAETTYESPYGRIRCAWTIQDGKSFQLSISVPPNSSAVVILPEKNGPRNDQAKADDAGILCHSGEYTFACEYVAPGPWPPKPLMTGFREPEDEDIE